jgi:hypothetical protein
VAEDEPEAAYTDWGRPDPDADDERPGKRQRTVPTAAAEDEEEPLDYEGED